jgi:glycosyltransferase involved in cell wall biosynthesis
MGPMVYEPRVSIVTPFFNTAAYIAECVESVLAQSYENFEYLLVNNKSTDGTREIALQYAQKDSRIKVVDNDIFVGQAENYNGALKQIGDDSRYVKVVQADDSLYPDCLRSMVSLAERDPRIGLVSSYYLNGDEPRGVGLPHDTWQMTGPAVCRLMLMTGCFLVGTPSVVLYRADVVRARQTFYAPGDHHPDTDAAYRILLEHDFGFVQQILSFCRTQNDSITSKRIDFNPAPLDYLITLERYGRAVLSTEEFRRLRTRNWDNYWRFLASSLLRGKGQEFWEYHREGLGTIGVELKLTQVLPKALEGVARLAMDPASTADRLLAKLSGKKGRWT